MRILARLHELLSRRALASLCLCSSPCRQRRLSAPVRAAVDAAALLIAAIPLSVVLGRKEKPVSFGCAPEGAKTMPRIAHRPAHRPCRTHDRMKNTVSRRATRSRRSFLAACRGRRLASADFSQSLVASCGGRVLHRPPRFFGVSGFVVALQSGTGIVIQDAQRIRLDRACHDLNRLLDEPGPEYRAHSKYVFGK